MLSHNLVQCQPNIGSDANTSSVLPLEVTNYEQMIFSYLLKNKSRSLFPTFLPTGIKYDRNKLKNFINELGELESDWDGHGGLSISKTIINHAIKFIDIISFFPDLPNPEVSPKSNGIISFIWETSYGEGYIEIGNTTYSGYLLIPSQGNIFLEGVANSINEALIGDIYWNLFQEKISTPITRIYYSE